MNKIQSQVQKRFGRETPTLTEAIYRDCLKIPKKRFGQILRNNKQPTLDEVQRIADWLGVNANELINLQ